MIKRRKRRFVPRLNTTSTADISFMLLVFFLVTTSMDADKGLRRMLPPIDNKKELLETEISKDRLMEIEITSADSAFVDGQPIVKKRFRRQVLDFICRVGKQHVITVNASPESSYDTYFQIQNEIMMAYADVRNGISLKLYNRPFSRLDDSERDRVRELCPMRVSEQYNVSAGTREEEI